MLFDFLLVLNLCKDDCEDLCFKLDWEERCLRFPSERFDDDSLFDKLLEIMEELLSSTKDPLVLAAYIDLCNSEKELFVLIVGSVGCTTSDCVEADLDTDLSRPLCQNFHLEPEVIDAKEEIDGECW